MCIFIIQFFTCFYYCIIDIHVVYVDVTYSYTMLHFSKLILCLTVVEKVVLTACFNVKNHVKKMGL